MNKIICEICGTSYLETSDCCPICGCSREYSQQSQEEYPRKMPEYIPEGGKKGGLFSAAQKKYQKDFYDEEDEDELLEEFPDIPVPRREHRVMVPLVVVLTVLIALSLLASGFLFFRYELPGRASRQPETENLPTTAPALEETETTEAPTVPCQSLVLTAGAPVLTRQGQYWLLHVIVMPEDTTDPLTYVSADENVVTVTREGRLCAVGSGDTTVTISCGTEQIVCPVTVAIGAETEATLPPATTRATEATEPSQEPAAVSEQVETEPSAPKEGVVLKLKQTDITFTKKGVTYQLELDCDLKPEEVTWLTINSKIAIVHDGVITVVGSGTTKIVAQYQGQEAVCIVRCNLK